MVRDADIQQEHDGKQDILDSRQYPRLFVPATALPMRLLGAQSPPPLDNAKDANPDKNETEQRDKVWIETGHNQLPFLKDQAQKQLSVDQFARTYTGTSISRLLKNTLITAKVCVSVCCCMPLHLI